MKCRRAAGPAVLGLVWLSLAGCDEWTPPSGSQAIVPANHQENQQAKFEQFKASMKVRPFSPPRTLR
jgi:hypothetical protein